MKVNEVLIKLERINRASIEISLFYYVTMEHSLIYLLCQIQDRLLERAPSR